jgi:hypothetical protein
MVITVEFQRECPSAKITNYVEAIKNQPLKKKNKALVEKLEGFYEEIDRYKYTKVTSYTDKLIKEIENLSRLKKEGILKDEEFDSVKKRIFEKIL